MECTVEISKAMIDHYLSSITGNWFGDHDVPPENIHEYLPLVDNMKIWANHRGELNYLKLALQYLLAHSELNYEEYAGSCYPYDNEEMHEIIELVYSTLWSDSSPPENMPNVRLVEMPLEEWWARKRV